MKQGAFPGHQKQVKGNANEYLTTMLYALVESIDLEVLIEKNQVESFNRQIEDYCERALLGSTEFFSRFRKIMLCTICGITCVEVILKCRHGYCKQCLKEIILEDTKGNVILNSYEMHLLPKCRMRMCNSVVPLKFYSELFGSSLSRHQENSKNREKTQNKSKFTCNQCEIVRDYKYAYYTCCEICMFCACLRQKQNEASCPYCRTKQIFQDNLISFKCSRCETIIDIATNYGCEVCDSHVHCLDCLMESWRFNHCLTCKADFRISGKLNEIYSLLFKECYNCRNVLEFKNFVSKNCCDFNLCLYCQNKSEDKENCLICGCTLVVECFSCAETMDTIIS